MRRRNPLNEEPLTFTSRDVVELLDSAGYERYARFVQSLANDVKVVRMTDQQWQDKYDALLKRLHKYEPPVISTGRSYRPGPMSDG